MGMGTKKQERFKPSTGYIQKNHPHPVTSCGRRRPFMQDDSPLAKLRKTTRGKGRHFLLAVEGGGMTEAGRKAYKRENPGSTLSAPVTGKVKPGSKAAKRRKSYCARSAGQLKRSSAKTRNDPNSRIRQARRRWRC